MSEANHTSNDSGADLVVAIIGGVLGLLWRYRVELVLAALPALAYVRLKGLLGADVAGVLVGLGVGLVLLVAPIRRGLARLLTRARWRRRIERALRQLAPRCFGDLAPLVGRIRTSHYGVHVGLRLRPGHAPVHLEQAAEHLAAALRVREVRVERERQDGSVVYLTLVRVDPFGEAVIASPLVQAARTDLWHALPIGLDETGRAVTLSLPERSVLVGGEPAAGKSALMQQLAAFAALDPSVGLYCLDPKVVELSRWAPVAAGVAGADLDEAISVLRSLAAEMDRRYRFLAEHHRRKLEPGDGLGLQVLLVDELMIYLTGEKKQAAELASLLRRLVALGRAAGIVCVLATQKPSADVVPSSIRDNVAYRVAFRTTTREASDTILGGGWATIGYSATDIDAGLPGVCWLLAEGSSPRKLRSAYLSDDELDAIVARAKALRR